MIDMFGLRVVKIERLVCIFSFFNAVTPLFCSKAIVKYVLQVNGSLDKDINMVWKYPIDVLKNIEEINVGPWNEDYQDIFPILLTIFPLGGRVIRNPHLSSPKRIAWGGDLSKGIVCLTIYNLTLNDSGTFSARSRDKKQSICTFKNKKLIVKAIEGSSSQCGVGSTDFFTTVRNATLLLTSDKNMINIKTYINEMEISSNSNESTCGVKVQSNDNHVRFNCQNNGVRFQSLLHTGNNPKIIFEITSGTVTTYHVVRWNETKRFILKYYKQKATCSLKIILQPQYNLSCEIRFEPFIEDLGYSLHWNAEEKYVSTVFCIILCVMMEFM